MQGGEQWKEQRNPPLIYQHQSKRFSARLASLIREVGRAGQVVHYIMRLVLAEVLARAVQ